MCFPNAGSSGLFSCQLCFYLKSPAVSSVFVLHCIENWISGVKTKAALFFQLITNEHLCVWFHLDLILSGVSCLSFFFSSVTMIRWWWIQKLLGTMSVRQLESISRNISGWTPAPPLPSLSLQADRSRSFLPPTNHQGDDAAGTKDGKLLRRWPGLTAQWRRC